MSDKEHAIAVLWDAERNRAKHIPFAVVPAFGQRSLGGKKVISLVAGEKSDNIFSEQPLGSSGFGERLDEAEDGEEQAAASPVESLPISGHGQVLAREAERPEVRFWDRVWFDGLDVIVPPLSFRFKDGLVGSAGELVPFNVSDTTHARILQAPAHAAYARKQVEKLQHDHQHLLVKRQRGDGWLPLPRPFVPYLHTTPENGPRSAL